MAVTGSIDQRGDVQAVSAINEKIEGFFDICLAGGLTGEQGVIIPASNKRHLVLRDDVIDAVAAGTFHIYAVSTVDDGIEVLTGMPAGSRDETGSFPQRTVNYRIEQRLAAFAKQARAFRTSAQESKE